VLLADDDLLDGDTVSGSHGEVGESSEDSDHGGDGVVETLRLVDALAGVTKTSKAATYERNPP
jgi:hypothetical protein